MKWLCVFILTVTSLVASAYTRQDTLRGSNGRGRSWWDVKHYDLTIVIDRQQKSIRGNNAISFTVTDSPVDSMQLDLQVPMQIDSVRLDDLITLPTAIREENVYWIQLPGGLSRNSRHLLRVFFHGKPRVAVNPPWDGGLIWSQDDAGSPWVAVACQGLGASAWWPCKDYQGDEPDDGMRLSMDHSLAGEQLVSNGTLSVSDPNDSAAFRKRYMVHKALLTRKEQGTSAPTGRTEWVVRNPINTYNTTFYLGDYVSWTDTLQGEKGVLPLSFYCLRQNEAKARKQFAVVKDMLHCFEWWMGPYPFYEDGYKLVEAPYLGMEHQSAVAYGNKYQMGYLGNDLSGTGVGLLFDYLIIHESGHEWFGNNITATDIADNWIHEGFTTYTETLFAECLAGKEAARRYQLGRRWERMKGDRPVIGAYGVNDEGSGDKYVKGAAVVHAVRTLMDNDDAFRQLLRGLNDTFYHKTVSTAEVEGYVARHAGLDLQPLFDQYLRTPAIPELEWYRQNGRLYTRLNGAVPGLSLPVPLEDGPVKTVAVGTSWSDIPWPGGKPRFGADYLLTVKAVSRPKP